MKSTFNNFLQLFLLIFGVIVAEADEVKTVSVMEGESVTLNTGVTETQKFNQIQWRFGDKGSVIAQTDGNVISYPSLTEIFTDRRQIDQQTGSLTIKNMRIKHSGLYKLKIDQNNASPEKIFSVTVYESPSVIDGYKAEMKTVSKKEGDSVTLQTDLTETHGDELIVWRFGDEGKLIAKYDNETKISPLLDTDERLRDRLELDHQNGSLTITDTRTTDSGLYTVKISSSKQMLYKKFTVTVSVGPPLGAILWTVFAVLVAAAVAAGVIYKRSRIPVRQRIIDSMKPETVECKEGEYAVLQSYYDIMKGIQMLWTRVSVKESAIASMSEKDKKTYWYDERFGGRLQLDPHNGSLIIRNTRKTDAGVYVLEIKSRGVTMFKKYEVILTGKVKTVSVKEGDNVTLECSEDGKYISWMFTDGGLKNVDILIDNESECPDGRFRDRLQLDKQKGSLTIKNIRTEHTGLYVAMFDSLSNTGFNFKQFRVVFDDLTETSENESVITGFLGRILRFCGQARIEGVFGVEKDEMKTLSVIVGDDLILNTDTEIQTDDEIILRFGAYFSKDRPYVTIARFSKPGDEFKSEESGYEDRLLLDLTGPLTITITDFRNTDCGQYYVQIINKNKKSFKSFTFIVVRRDAVKSVSVTKGKPIKLESPVTDLQKDDQILWTFGPNGMIIADTKTSRCDKRFRDRVTLDKETGSLTISKITTEDEGVYNRQIISSNRVIHQRFDVTVLDAVYSDPMLEGDSIDLESPITNLHEDDQILWTFGPNDMIIADTKTSRCDERFRGRVTLDKETGSLTIRESSTADAGEYNLHISSSNRVIHHTFYVNVLEFPKATTRDQPRAEFPKATTRDQPRAGHDSDYSSLNQLLAVFGAAVILQMQKVQRLQHGISQEQPDSSKNRENESVTVVMPLLRGENEEEGTSSL